MSLELELRFPEFIVNGRIKAGTWNDIENHKIYMEWLGKKLGYTCQEDWYKISKKDLTDNYGYGLLTKYNGRVDCVKSIFPNYEWVDWKFTVGPFGYWNKIENQKKYMEWLGNKLGYTSMEDWYKVNQKDFVDNYGATLLSRKYNGLLQCLKSIFPNYEWLPWKFTNSLKGFWDNIENQKAYMKWLGNKLGYTCMEDWYKISTKDFQYNYGNGLCFSKYNGSAIQTVKVLFPNYEWLSWKFSHVPQGYWADIKNQKEYMEWLEKKLGYTSTEDWYKISKQDFVDNYGAGLLNKYNSSSKRCVISIFSNYEWLPWKFTRAQSNYWNDIKNQKEYMESLGKKLGYTCQEDWYKVTRNDFTDNYGRGLINIYGNLVHQPIKSIFPNYEWLPWKFAFVTKGFWDNIENHKAYMEWLGNKLGYTCMEDWYKITIKDFADNDGGGLLSHKYSTSCIKLVITVFPEYDWDLSKFRKRYSKGQIEWLEFLKITIPDIQHAINNDEGEFRIPNSRYHADGYSEEENIILEYHGDFWHGNPKIHNPSDINAVSKKTFGELYNNTVKKQRFCEDAGFICIYIWESEWLRGKNAVRMIQRAFKNK